MVYVELFKLGSVLRIHESVVPRSWEFLYNFSGEMQRDYKGFVTKKIPLANSENSKLTAKCKVNTKDSPPKISLANLKIQNFAVKYKGNTKEIEQIRRPSLGEFW